MNDYEVYLATDAAHAGAHGIFVVVNDPNGPHGKRKTPDGAHGVLDFRDPAVVAVVRTRTDPTHRLLGRRFGTGDDIICIDCDGWIPGEDWTNGTGYREISSSGTGCHIICRVPDGITPAGGNKIKRTVDGKEIELFYGPGVGVALTGRDATAGSINLDMTSRAGGIVSSLLASAPAEPARKPAIQTQNITPPKEKGELSFWQTFAVKLVKENARSWEAGKRGIPKTASEAFQSVCTRAAYDLVGAGFSPSSAGFGDAVYDVFLTTPVYSEFYSPGAGHNLHPAKIEVTINKAIIAAMRKEARDAR